MEEIYQKYAKSVYRFLLTKVKSADLAEELTQETFYQAIRSINHFDGSSKLSTWLFGIAQNQVYNYMRKHPAEADITDFAEELVSHDRVEEKVLASMDRVEMIRLLHSCEEPYREVLYQRIYGNLSFREIGDIAGKTESWARVTYYRGKEKLKAAFEKKGEVEGYE